MYLLKFQRHGWNSIVSPGHKYSLKIGINSLERAGILQDLLAITYTFNYSIYFILEYLMECPPSYTSENNGMSESGKKPPSLLVKITHSEIFLLKQILTRVVHSLRQNWKNDFQLN